MYQVVTVLVTQKNMPALHAFLCEMCSLAKKLHNAALFRLRNHFTAKGKDSLTENEQQVEDEVAMLVKSGIRAPGAVISYTKLEKLMRITENPDFFAGLPMQSAQWVLKKAAGDMSSWLRSLKSYKAGTPGFTGKPRMPKYKKGRLDNLTFTNQDAVIHHTKEGRAYLKMPLTKETVLVPDVMEGYVLKQAEVKPLYGSFRLLLTFGPGEDAPMGQAGDGPSHEKPAALNIAAVDFGVSNTASIVTNEGSALLYKGGALKAENQWFNKHRAQLVSAAAKGADRKHVQTKALDHNSLHRELFVTDNLHKGSRSIIDYPYFQEVSFGPWLPHPTDEYVPGWIDPVDGLYELHQTMPVLEAEFHQLRPALEAEAKTKLKTVPLSDTWYIDFLYDGHDFWLVDMSLLSSVTWYDRGFFNFPSFDWPS